jgi:enediyne biosynthesis protein E7
MVYLHVMTDFPCKGVSLGWCVCMKQTPGPRGVELLRMLIDFYRDPLGMFAETARKYGDLFRIEVGPYRVYVVAQPQHAKHILQDNNHNYEIGGVFDRTTSIVGQGLTTSNGGEWLQQRRRVQTAFNHERVEYFAAAIPKLFVDVSAQWTPGKPFDILQELLSLNHRILGKMLFSVEWDTPDHPLVQALGTVREYMNRRVGALFTMPESVPTRRNRAFGAASEVLIGFIDAEIEARRAGIRRPEDVLTALVETGMDKHQLRDEIITLLFAAYEDAANGLSWALLLLDQHPDIMKKLLNEVDPALKDGLPTMKTGLPFTRMVLREAMRLYPPTWGLLRDSIFDDEIDGHFIPGGSIVYVNVHMIHRSPQFWDDPDSFIPARFANDGSTQRSRFAYIPFGGGPRQCIGADFALLQMQLILATLVQRFTVRLVPGQRVELDARSSLRPKHGLQVILDHRV